MNLRPRFLLLTALFFSVVAVPSWLVVRHLAESIVAQWAAHYAEKQVLYDKSRTLQPILREVALSRQLAESRLLRDWARDPDRTNLQQQALAEAEGYRSNFQDQSYFIALLKNRHYYYNNASDEFAGRQFRYRLDPDAPKDAWFFDLIHQGRDLHINVNPDPALGITKLWIDVLVRDGADVLGIVGTGLDLPTFIHDVVDEAVPGVTSLFVDQGGAIQIHRNQTLIDFGTVSKPPRQRNTIHLLFQREADYQAIRAAMRALEHRRNGVQTLYVQVDGKRQLAGVAYLPEIDWFEITLLDLQQVLPMSQFGGLMLVYGLTLAGLLLLFNLAIRRYVLKPLQQLERAIAAVETGGPAPKTEAPPDRGEIGRLMQHFSDMALTVTESRMNLEAKVQERTAAIERLSKIDALTGLPNRVLLADRLQQAMAQAQRSQHALAVAYLDLDGFKEVNDRHGHDKGDELLVQLAARMKAVLREGDTLARIGGDEFVAVLVHLERPSDHRAVLERLLEAAAKPITHDATALQVSASIGVTLYPQDAVEADQLIRHADQAMYAAKQAGKNRYQLYEVVEDAAGQVRLAVLDHIGQALAHGQFLLHYQPKVNMASGQVTSAEALLRWQHPQRGLLAPGEFLHLIEGHALSVALGEWVITSALAQLAAWRRDGVYLTVSVNIATSHLQQANFLERLQALLQTQPDVPAACLTLEVLETSALQDTPRIAEMIDACHALGVQFALDDFGTGYSSLTYLRRLPVKTLKIDPSFVREIHANANDLAIVKGVIGLARAFGREVVAEGVETMALGNLLLSIGCEQGQGFGIARPMPPGELPDWIERWYASRAWLAWRESAASPGD